MSEKDEAKYTKYEKFWIKFSDIFDYVLYVLIVTAILIGIADYFRDSLGTWYSQNWIIVTIGVGISFPVWFLIAILTPDPKYNKKMELKRHEAEELEKHEEELKRSIIRKKILKEKSAELDSLNLTDEEKEYQIEKWVEKVYYA